MKANLLPSLQNDSARRYSVNCLESLREMEIYVALTYEGAVDSVVIMKSMGESVSKQVNQTARISRRLEGDQAHD